MKGHRAAAALAGAAAALLASCGPMLEADAPAARGNLIGASSGLAVGATGLSIDFGRTEASTVQAMSRLLGAGPSAIGTRTDCGPPPVTVASWERGFDALFENGDFRGWRATSEGFATVQGIAVGGRQEDVIARGGGIRPGLSSDGLTLDGVSGELDETGRIAALWAGRVCREL